MALAEQEILARLDRYGHLKSPHGKDAGPWPSNLGLDQPRGRLAVESFQAFHSQVLEPLVAKYHPSRLTPAVNADGEIGPATLELLETSRCDVPDYDLTLPAVGSGNWPRCWDIGEFHAAIVKVNTSGMPAYLKPLWEEVWKRVVTSYDEVGVRFIRRDDAPKPNIDITFVNPDGGWIGLAIVGQGQKCGDRIWAKFDKGYQPANLLSEWSTLVRHELGHNCGLSHSQGGTMNPFIIKGLPVSWKNDPSWPLLASRFGGKPIPNNGPAPYELVIARLYQDGHYEKVMTVPDGTDDGGPFPE